MNDDVDTLLTPEKLEAAIRRLEAERARRAANKPPAAMTTERVFVADAPARLAPPAPVKAEPRPRKSRKQEVPATPVPFFIVTTKPVNGVTDDAGAIEEGWFLVSGGQVFLCDSGGTVNGEGRKVEERGALWTARQMLRGRRMSRPGEPSRGPIRYKQRGWI